VVFEPKFKDKAVQVVLGTQLKAPALRSSHYHSVSSLQSLQPEKNLDEEALSRAIASFVVDQSEERERGLTFKETSSTKSKLPKNILDKEKHSVQDPCKGSCVTF